MPTIARPITRRVTNRRSAGTWPCTIVRRRSRAATDFRTASRSWPKRPATRGAPWAAFFLFVKWARLGAQSPEGHLESDYLVRGVVRSRGERAIGEMPLERRQSAARAPHRRATRRRADAPLVGRDARRGIRRRGRVTEPGEVRGVVLGGTGGVWQVRTDGGETVDAGLRGRLKKSNSGKRADGSLRRDTVSAAATHAQARRRRRRAARPVRRRRRVVDRRNSSAALEARAPRARRRAGRAHRRRERRSGRRHVRRGEARAASAHARPLSRHRRRQRPSGAHHHQQDRSRRRGGGARAVRRLRAHRLSRSLHVRQDRRRVSSRCATC